jgi:hypothetical protein
LVQSEVGGGQPRETRDDMRHRDVGRASFGSTYEARGGATELHVDPMSAE